MSLLILHLHKSGKASSPPQCNYLYCAGVRVSICTAFPARRWAETTGQQEHQITIAHAAAVLAEWRRLMWLPGQRQHAWADIQRLFTAQQLPVVNAAHFLVSAAERLAAERELTLEEQVLLVQVLSTPGCRSLLYWIILLLRACPFSVARKVCRLCIDSQHMAAVHCCTGSCHC